MVTPSVASLRAPHSNAVLVQVVLDFAKARSPRWIGCAFLMSLLDTIASSDSDLDVGIAAPQAGSAVAGRGLAETFASSSDDEGGSHERPMAALLDTGGGGDAVVAPTPKPKAKQRRGRPRGPAALHALRRSAVAKAIEPRPSRSAICSAAAKARWQKFREGQQPIIDTDPQPASTSAAIVPFQDNPERSDGAIISFSRAFDSALQQLVSILPQVRKAVDIGVELAILVQSTRMLSKQALAEFLQKDEKTVAHKQRLLAACIVLSKRYRLFQVFETIQAHCSRKLCRCVSRGF